ncbi:MAG: O-antigen ligase family protein [Phycisphaerae bacterium]|nr:O-antigen ligase family protein [Phycisphaerae bacterium]
MKKARGNPGSSSFILHPSSFFLVVVAAVTLGAFALVGSSVLPPEGLIIYWASIGGVAAFIYYAIKGDLLSAVLLWFVTLILLHEEFWRVELPHFFSLTIPRIGIAVLVVLLAAMVMLGRVRLRHAWPISGAIAAVVAYFLVSALVGGFETRSVVSVHYRLIGGYIFPFTVFGLVLHGFATERDFRRLAVFFAVVSAYLVFTGWCEHLGLRALIFPRFINDPSVGIHWGRVRGPFVMSAAMGLALTYCYFNNLVLARNLRSGRWLLYGLNALMLPAIFWTKTRSVWLAFALCSLIWVAYSRRRTTRVIGVSLLLALGLLIGVINMDNFLGADRAKGGLTDMEPILLRVGLAKMTWQIFQEHPVVGVGFGHFRDRAPAFARDPSSGAYAFGSSALEHNNLLSILAETGAVGILLYVVMMILLLRCSVRLYRKLPSCGSGFINRDMLVLYWILAMAYFVDGTFRETSDNPFANSLFFGLSAVPVALDILLSPAPIRPRLGFPPIGLGNRRGPHAF